MSSELYVRWEVENRERLHQQLKERLDLERQRQADLLRSISSAIGSITSKINSAKNSAVSSSADPVVSKERLGNVSDYDTGEVVTSGFSSSIEDTTVQSGDGSARQLLVIDWSNLLDSFEAETSDKVKKLTYAQQISSQLASAILETDDQVKAHNDFVAYLNSLLRDEELDFEYFKNLVDRRMQSLKTKIDFLEPEEITEDLFEYYALCELLGVKRRHVSKDNLKKECRYLFEQYAEKQKEQYVYQNLMEVFEELHMSVVDEMVLDGLSGHKVVDETLPDFSIFMSMDGGGIVFETVAEVDSNEILSSDKKAVIEESAQKVCQKHLQVIKKMQERGIYLKVECETKPKAERIRKVRTNKAKKTQRSRKQEQFIGG
jgi:hypothetical protein